MVFSLEKLEKLLGPKLKHDFPTSKLCSFRVGGPARYFYEADNYREIELVAAVLQESSLRYYILGRGSNVLVSDEGFPGILIKLSDNFSEISFEGQTGYFGGFTLLPEASKKTFQRGLKGFEWAIGVPGSAGGSIKTNAGCLGYSTADTLLYVEAYDFEKGQMVTIEKKDLNFSYRHSNLEDSQLILKAVHRFEPDNQDEIRENMRIVLENKWQTQPKSKNAGSVFINPQNFKAAELIESLNLKGYKHNSAKISDLHANFIISEKNGSANDVYFLINMVKKEVYEKYGIELETEIKLLGFDAK